MLKIAVCGLGTVGKSFVDHFLNYQDLISKNCGQQIEITIIADRSINKKSLSMIALNFLQIFSVSLILIVI